MISLHTFLSCANRKPPPQGHVLQHGVPSIFVHSPHPQLLQVSLQNTARERIHKFPVAKGRDFHLQWLAITDWERVLLYFACPFHNFLSSASRVPLPLLAKVIMHSHAMLWYSCVCVATIGRIWDWQIALNLQSFHFFVVTSKEYWQDLSHRKFH